MKNKGSSIGAVTMGIKRAKLVKIENVSVISSGYGELLGSFKVGKIVGSNSRSVQISFRDANGAYIENYATLDGTRVEDIGCSTGLRVSPKEWRASANEFLPSKFVDKGFNSKSRMRLLNRGERSLEDVDGSTSKLVVEIWEDCATNVKYMRAVRETHNPETKRIKQFPTIVPFSIMTEVLADFESE